MTALVLALRGAAAVAVLVALVGGMPRVVQLGLAAAVGLWSAAVAGATVEDASWLLAGRELAIGATLGVVAAAPLLAVAMAGRLVDRTRGARAHGPYRGLFGLLGAAVFLGIDGHAAFVAGIARSFREVPIAPPIDARAVATLGALLPIAVRLALPWLIAAAAIEIAAGVALRVAGRAALHAPLTAGTEAALAMMTASLVGTLAVAIAAIVS